MTRKLYSFDDHPQHRAELAGWAAKWIANALSTQPPHWPAVQEAVAGLYRAADLTPPPSHRVVQVRSPMTAAIAGTVAAGVWWLRDHPDEHRALFGRSLSEQDLMAGIGPACRIAVQRGMAALTGDRAATGDATDAATGAATRVATSDATRAATSDATRAATRVATRAATSAATSDATSDATRAATSAATDDATSAATDDATSDATSVATDAATRAATRDATRVATDAATDAATSFYLGCMGSWWRMHNGGSDWSPWSAYLSFFRHIVRLDLPVYERWRHYETLAVESASRIMHTRFCIVSDRHTAIHLDQQNRLHSGSGAARRWGDGWAVWYWHGTPVPRSLIEDGWDPQRILTEPNAEIRRAAIERLGWPAFITAADLRQVRKAVADPGNTGQELTLWDIPEQIFDQPVRVLLVVNGSPEPDGGRRRFGLTVPAGVADPVAAQAWAADDPASPVRVTPKLYAQMARRT